MRQPDDYDSTEHALFEAEKEIARLSSENAALVKEREELLLANLDEVNAWKSWGQEWADKCAELMSTLAERDRELALSHQAEKEALEQVRRLSDEEDEAITFLRAQLAETQEKLKEAENAANDKEARLGAIERRHECEGDGCPVCEELTREESAVVAGPKGLDGFGERLKRMRAIRNLTQREVAERSGLVSAHVSHFETGERLPNLGNLRALCVALSVSADYLIDLDDDGATHSLRAEMDAFVKHVGAPSFKEAVDVLFRTKEQDEDKIEGMFNKIKEQGAELQQLRAWKESALAVMPDYQEIARLLDIPLGVSVHDKIVPGIQSLRNAVSSQPDLTLIEEVREGKTHERPDPQSAIKESKIELMTKLLTTQLYITELRSVLLKVSECKLFYEDSADIDNYTTDDVMKALSSKQDISLVEEVEGTIKELEDALCYFNRSEFWRDEHGQAIDRGRKLLTRLNPRK